MSGTGESSPISIVPLSVAPELSVVAPGSKSYTNRALMAAALASGESHLSGALFSDDTRYMAASLNALGIAVQSDKATRTFDVSGQGGRLADVEADLFVGNAGTAARFLTAAVGAGRGRYRLDGVARMRKRPMAHLLSALKTLGVEVQEEGEPGCFPITVSGKTRPEEGERRVSLPGDASSQFISGLLLAAPAYGGALSIQVEGELVSKPYLDMTLSVMKEFGVEVSCDRYRSFNVEAGQSYTACNYAVEPDASAASYFYAAAAITGGRISVEGLGTNTQQGDWKLVDILEKMGAKVEREPNRTTVTGTGTLRGIEIDMADMSDVAQTLAVVAPFATSPTRITGIGFIRHKETDRVGNVVKELGKLGVRAIEEDGGYVIYPGVPKGGLVETYDDHRMAMSFALIGLRVPGMSIANPACTGKTFPEYFDVLEKLRS